MNTPPVPQPCTRSLFDDLVPRFDGETFDERLDGRRLRHQLGRVFAALSSGGWYSLDELAAITGDRSQASIGARVRDLRKRRFGGFTIDRRRRAGTCGTHEYRLVTQDSAGVI